MNAVSIVIGVLLFLCVVTSWCRGLFKAVVSAAGLILSMVVAVYVAPQVSAYIKDNTKIDDMIAKQIEESLPHSEQGEELSRAMQVSVINELPLPEGLKSNLLNNNNSETYDVLGASGVYDYISKSSAVIIVNSAVFLLMTAAFQFLFFLLSKTTDLFSKLPIVKTIDKWGGAAIGAVKGVVLIWLFFIVLSISSTFAWSQELTAQVMQSDILKLLYDHNILLDIVGDLTRVLFH